MILISPACFGFLFNIDQNRTAGTLPLHCPPAAFPAFPTSLKAGPEEACGK